MQPGGIWSGDYLDYPLQDFVWDTQSNRWSGVHAQRTKEVFHDSNHGYKFQLKEIHDKKFQKPNVKGAKAPDIVTPGANAPGDEEPQPADEEEVEEEAATPGLPDVDEEARPDSMIPENAANKEKYIGSRVA